ncbi:MAG: winged helix-turn-helix domain-containing protein [Acidobacteriia bacterium]|nr:winged helix-turn-helix domain-containing protein [Terriglobia bacterium]
MAMEQELRLWRESLEQELVELNDDYQEISQKMSRIRQQIEAIDRLLPDVPEHPSDMEGLAFSAIREHFTPAHIYWPAILESLLEFGGSAKGDQVIERVGQKLDHILTPGDRERLPSGIDVRWRNRTAWQRFNMVRQGLVKSGSPRGVWEITDEGKQWLETMKRTQK